MTEPTATRKDLMDLLAQAEVSATRLRILTAIAEAKAPISPNLLSRELGLPLGNVSYHVTLLAGKPIAGKPSPFADAPPLTLAKTEPRRGALEHFYELAVEVAA